MFDGPSTAELKRRAARTEAAEAIEAELAEAFSSLVKECGESYFAGDIWGELEAADVVLAKWEAYNAK